MQSWRQGKQKGIASFANENIERGQKTKNGKGFFYSEKDSLYPCLQYAIHTLLPYIAPFNVF